MEINSWALLWNKKNGRKWQHQGYEASMTYGLSLLLVVRVQGENVTKTRSSANFMDHPSALFSLSDHKKVKTWKTKTFLATYKQDLFQRRVWWYRMLIWFYGHWRSVFYFKMPEGSVLASRINHFSCPATPKIDTLDGHSSGPRLPSSRIFQTVGAWQLGGGCKFVLICERYVLCKFYRRGYVIFLSEENLSVS